MAVYKVPQDVEAEDKLLGPFSFRQFIYLIIALMGVVLAWGLAQLFIPLAVLPLPIIVLFGALALPLRKDQPMEVYLAALLSFYFKPRKRLWQADGVQSLVEIVVPESTEENRIKNLSENETLERLSYLATLADTRGWSVRGVSTPQHDTSMQTDAFLEAQQTEDILDDTSRVTHSFNDKINQADAKRREEVMKLMNSPAAISQIPPIADPYTNLQSPSSGEPVNYSPISFNPYPSAMRQSVIHPSQPKPPAAQTASQAPPPQQPANPSNQTISPDIMRLVDEGTELSVATIEREARRIREKEEKSSGEVVISLR